MKAKYGEDGGRTLMGDNTSVQPCLGPSCFSVLEYGFQLIPLVYRYFSWPHVH